MFLENFMGSPGYVEKEIFGYIDIRDRFLDKLETQPHRAVVFFLLFVNLLSTDMFILRIWSLIKLEKQRYDKRIKKT